MTRNARGDSHTRAVGYVRLSRDADDSTSVARQREIIARTCEARGTARDDAGPVEARFTDGQVAVLAAAFRDGAARTAGRVSDGRVTPLDYGLAAW